jgi:hypothetical protein
MNAMRTMGLAPVLPSDTQVEELAGEYVVHLGVCGFACEELDVEICVSRGRTSLETPAKRAD